MLARKRSCSARHMMMMIEALLHDINKHHHHRLQSVQGHLGCLIQINGHEVKSLSVPYSVLKAEKEG